MNAGLPTTGIGGIFYSISVLFMIIAEIVITLRGKSSIPRWKFVTEQVFLVTGIIGSSFFTAFLLSKTIPPEIKSKLSSISGNAPLVQDAETLFLIPFVILAVLLVVTQLIRAYIVIKRKLSNPTPSL